MRTELRTEGNANPFPFPKSFQFREHEASAVEGLFERAFFDVAYPDRALEALQRNQFVGAGEPAEWDAEALRSVILCRGADGIGKTRIFHHLRERAGNRRVPVYEIYNYDVEGIPLKPLLHTVRQIIQDLDFGSALLEKYRYALEYLIPEAYETRGEFEGPGGALGDRLAADKVRVFDGLTQLLLEVATRKPLLILVHDLHFGDLATVEFLEYIGRNVGLRDELARRERRRRQDEPTPGEEPTSSAPGADGEGYLGDQRHSVGDAGPELDGFDSGEWRVLTPRQTAPYAYGSWPGEPGGADDRGEGRERLQPTEPVRLMILANYRDFADPDHYIQAAIDRLGKQRFAYHSELKPLGREEADRFTQKAIAGVRIGDRPLEVSPDGVEAVYEASEGFPSFQQELFRGLFLTSGTGACWSAESIARFLQESDEGDEVEAQDDGPAKGADEGMESASRRHAILRRRLAGASDEERQTLNVLAVARRPVEVGPLQRLVSGLAASRNSSEALPASFSSGDEMELLVRGMEARGLVERTDRLRAGGARLESVGYWFRLWDYAAVVEETLDADLRREIHQRLAEECRQRLERQGGLDGPAGEIAYEIFYHFRRGTEPRRAIDYGRAAAERCVRSFAFQKARLIYQDLVELAEGEELLDQRLDFLERIARISYTIKDYAAAEAACRQIHKEEQGRLSLEARLRLLMLEADVVGTGDPARALKILGKGSKLLKNEVSPDGARLFLAITRFRLARQDWKRAINFALTGINICQKSKEEIRELPAFYQLMGQAFYRKGDYAHAVDNYQRGMEEAERRGDRALTVSILDELGRVYLERGEYFRSARYLYNALEIRQRENDVVGLCRSYDQLGLCYQRNGDYHKTIENLNLSLRLKERIGDIEGLNPTLGTLGDLYSRLGLYQRAIRYFRWEIDNSKALKADRLDETVWLADAFIRLGRVYLELGDVKQVERLCTQAHILATEFKHRSEEADANLLEGNVKAYHREWNAAEKSLKVAAEAHLKQGHRRRQASAILDLAQVKFSREQYDECLKLVARAQIIADEIKALDQQVRALSLKGNVHRFLKGGNADKVNEHLGKALELSQNLSDVAVLFDLFYSLAKFHHSHREFTEAANYYGKAESLLKRIVEYLPEDLGQRYQEDRRRKVFQEDVSRFRKEAQSRSTVAETRERGLTGADLRDRPVAISDYKALLKRILRLNRVVNQLHFYERLLEEAVELSGADRGLLLRVQKREYLPVAFQGFGSSPTQHPEYAAASQLTEETIRRGKSIVLSGGDDHRVSRFIQLGALAGRSVMAVPLMTEERIFGGIYIDRPASLGRFSSRDESITEAFVEHAAVSFQNRRHLDVAIQEPLTGFLTPSYFIDRLKEAYRWFNLHGKAFSLAGFYLPVLESALGEGRESLGEKVAHDVGELVPYRSAVCWGSPILYVLLVELDHAAAQEIVQRLEARLEALLGEEVPCDALPAATHYQQGAEIYYELRRKLLPEECEQKTISEFRSLLSQDVTIKEAKMILEKHIIERTLRKTGGNITHAARLLGIHRPQLSNLLKKYSLKREVFEG
ncbi:MAG: tetratricopeptide repeat protein [Planctomycetota bacterium]|nr:tetratricopeptide repeat protein [Planctomycetota bacterium]